jgi:pimeloyl-ACP methyl ester carboxylesterase
MDVIPRTRYTKSGDITIAYQVTGRGPTNVIFVLGFVTHIEMMWEEPGLASMLRRLASFSRLVLFDKRGVGLSDRSVGNAALEERMDDLRAVMDAAGVQTAHLVGISEGCPMSALFAATYPERTASLTLIAGGVRSLVADDYPWGVDPVEYDNTIAFLVEHWGKPIALNLWAPSKERDPGFRKWWASYLRNASTPGGVRSYMQMNSRIDVRNVLPAIRVPTLILHRTGDRLVRIEASRFIASNIPGARLIELPGDDHLPWVGDMWEIMDPIEEFITGERHTPDPDRVLATVMYTDIVSSTEQLASVGDRKWHELLDAHNAIVRKEIARFRGREVNTAGDSFLATFDGPARAIRCARAIQDAVVPLGIGVRAGLHTGEIEIVGDDIAGIAVHTGARVAAMAAGGEVLVSGTVKDLVAGSGIEFAERGEHKLKGVPGEWRIYSVISA